MDILFLDISVKFVCVRMNTYLWTFPYDVR